MACSFAKASYLVWTNAVADKQVNRRTIILATCRPISAGPTSKPYCQLLTDHGRQVCSYTMQRCEGMYLAS
jgi:hypothetical protein